MEKKVDNFASAIGFCVAVTGLPVRTKASLLLDNKSFRPNVFSLSNSRIVIPQEQKLQKKKHGGLPFFVGVC